MPVCAYHVHAWVPPFNTHLASHANSMTRRSWWRPTLQPSPSPPSAWPSPQRPGAPAASPRHDPTTGMICVMHLLWRLSLARTCAPTDRQTRTHTYVHAHTHRLLTLQRLAECAFRKLLPEHRLFFAHPSLRNASLNDCPASLLKLKPLAAGDKAKERCVVRVMARPHDWGTLGGA